MTGRHDTILKQQGLSIMILFRLTRPAWRLQFLYTEVDYGNLNLTLYNPEMVSVACLLFFSLGLQQDKPPKEEPVFPKFYKNPTHGPTLVEFTLRVPIKSSNENEGGVVTFPAPSTYSGQVLVSLQVESKPRKALQSWVWKDRKDGLNSTIEATVLPEGPGAWISYTAQVLCPSEPSYRTMLKEYKPWLASTRCVQAADPEIIALAEKLSKGTTNRDEFVYKAVMWVAMNNGKPGEPFRSLDASSALACGGSCTNRANLCAALLRAKGIAARTVSHMPTWIDSKFYEHWLTEYWTEDGNWAMVEPTLGVKRPARNSVVVLSISSPEDENRAFDPEHLKLSMAGSPYLSLAEASSNLKAAELTKDDSINEVHLLKTFPNQAGSRIMTSGYRRSLKVISSAKLGHAERLDRQSVLSSIAKDPEDFAILLDDKQ